MNATPTLISMKDSFGNPLSAGRFATMCWIVSAPARRRTMATTSLWPLFNGQHAEAGDPPNRHVAVRVPCALTERVEDAAVTGYARSRGANNSPEREGDGAERSTTKPFGPGGSTRRLHHGKIGGSGQGSSPLPPTESSLAFCRSCSDGGEIGSTRAEETSLYPAWSAAMDPYTCERQRSSGAPPRGVSSDPNSSARRRWQSPGGLSSVRRGSEAPGNRSLHFLQSVPRQALASLNGRLASRPGRHVRACPMDSALPAEGTGRIQGALLVEQQASRGERHPLFNSSGVKGHSQHADGSKTADGAARFQPPVHQGGTHEEVARLQIGKHEAAVAANDKWKL